jgi:hypothetical protein
MALNLGDLIVNLEAATSQFNKAMDASAGKLKGIGDAAAAVTKTASVAFAGLAVGIGVAIRASSKQTEAELQLQNALKATGQSINIDAFKQLSSALQGVTRFGDEASLASQSLLVRLGATREAAQTLTPRVQDLAEGLGVSLTSATQLVGRALAGQVSSLSRYGIILTDVQKEVFKTGTAQEQLAALTGLLDSKFKGAAETAAKTGAAAFVQLGNAAGDLLEVFGKIVSRPLTPIIQALTGAVSSLVGFTDRLSEGFRTFVGVSALVTTGLTGATAAFAGMVLVMTKVIPLFKAMRVAALSTGKALLAAMAPVLTTIAALAAGIAGVILIVGSLRQAWDADLGGMRTGLLSFGSSVAQIWNDVVGFLTEEFSKFADFFEEKFVLIASFLSGATPEEAAGTLAETRAGGGLLAGTEPAVDAFVETLKAIGEDTTEIFTGVGETFSIGLGDLSAAGKKVAEDFGILAKASKDGAKATDRASGGAEDMAKDVAKGGAKVKKALGEVAESLTGKLRRALIPDLDAMDQALIRVKTGADDVATALDEQSRGMLEGIDISGGRAEIQSELQEVTQKFVDAFKAAGDTLLSAAGDVGQIVKSAIQGFQTGGVIGALVAVIAEVLTRLQSFKDMMDAGNETFFGLLESLNKLLEPIFGLIEVLDSAIAPALAVLDTLFESIGGFLEILLEPLAEIGKVLSSLGTILQAFEPALKLFGFIMEGLGFVFQVISDAIKEVVNFILEIVASIVGAFDQRAAAEIRASKIGAVAASMPPESLEDLTAAIDGAADQIFAAELPGLAASVGATVDQLSSSLTRAGVIIIDDISKATGSIGDSASGATTALDSMSKAADRASGRLLNVPTGFDVIAARRRASDFGFMQAQGASAAAGAAGPLAETIEVNIATDDPEEFFRRLERLFEQRRFTQSGAGVDSGGDFSTPQIGGQNI